ncbi:MAG: glycosyltransferase family 4 protein [Planctomycetota bacterium]|jgi:glycosyltransferase involved in cell wall biosynthesis
MSAFRMRIVHVDPEQAFSGGEVQVFLLMEGLRSRGHDCILACMPGSASEKRAQSVGIETCSLPMRNDFDFPAVLRLRKHLRAANADLVHLHTGRANWIGGMAARSIGLPAVTTRRMDRRVKRSWRTRLLYGRLVKRAAAISPAVLEHLIDAGVPRERTRLIWSAVDPSVLTPSKTREQLRKEWEVSDGQILALAAGNLVPRKGFENLLNALAQPGGSEDLRVWIAGHGEGRKPLETLIDSLGLQERVKLLGQRSDIPDLLAACDLFVMPSLAEGLGIAALEAMAASRPVIASRVGGLGELVVDEKTGLLVPPGDIPALASALTSLARNPELRERMGSAGPERVAEGFLADQMVESYIDLYREVLAEVGSES